MASRWVSGTVLGLVGGAPAQGWVGDTARRRYSDAVAATGTREPPSARGLVADSDEEDCDATTSRAARSKNGRVQRLARSETHTNGPPSHAPARLDSRREVYAVFSPAPPGTRPGSLGDSLQTQVGGSPRLKR